MATFDAAVIKEQGVTFAVVAVKRGLLAQPTRRQQAIESFSSAFEGLPVVLMEQNSTGRPKYFGRHDLVDFLATVHPARFPWGQYRLN